MWVLIAVFGVLFAAALFAEALGGGPGVGEMARRKTFDTAHPPAPPPTNDSHLKS